MMRFLLRMAVVALIAIGSDAAYAQNYPNRPITVIVPFGPGSATDTITRIVSQNLAAAMNASIIVENKAGANGAIAGTYVARSVPDGYTLLMATNSPLSAAQPTPSRGSSARTSRRR
jgi:tripartite-type tricarboxylate transporter receptor subunit TctC